MSDSMPSNSCAMFFNSKSLAARAYDARCAVELHYLCLLKGGFETTLDLPLAYAEGPQKGYFEHPVSAVQGTTCCKLQARTSDP